MILEVWKECKAKILKKLQELTTPTLPAEIQEQLNDLERQIEEKEQKLAELEKERVLKWKQQGRGKLGWPIPPSSPPTREVWDLKQQKEKLALKYPFWAYTNLEKKLEQIKELITKNEWEKLKNLMKKGEI